MLHSPYCSPSTSRAIKMSGANYIPPGIVIPGSGGCQGRKEDHAVRLCGHRTRGSHEYKRKPSSAKNQPEIGRTSPLALGNDQGKYSAGGSTAQKHSWKTTGSGGARRGEVRLPHQPYPGRVTDPMSGWILPALSNSTRRIPGFSVNGAFLSLPKNVLHHCPSLSLKNMLCPPWGMAK